MQKIVDLGSYLDFKAKKIQLEYFLSHPIPRRAPRAGRLGHVRARVDGDAHGEKRTPAFRPGQAIAGSAAGAAASCAGAGWHGE